MSWPTTRSGNDRTIASADPGQPGMIQSRGSIPAMAIGYFLDKEHQPAKKEIEAALAGKLCFWKDIVQFIENNYELTGELAYGGKNYGWNLWYRKGGKSLVCLYPGQGSFTAQVVLGRDQSEQALHLKFCRSVDRLLQETPQLHDGKWLFIPVKSPAEAKAVEKLLLLKKHPIRRKTL
ncbi:MAG TPA: DUF3788 family protein [Anaerolineales bacterium]|nr:DUF3788 family protein [Anaerolineales bacterium]